MPATDLVPIGDKTPRQDTVHKPRRHQQKLIDARDFRQTFTIGEHYQAKAQKSIKRSGIVVTVMTKKRNICAGFVPQSLIPESIYEDFFHYLVFVESSPNSPKRWYKVELIKVDYQEQFLTFKIICEIKAPYHKY